MCYPFYTQINIYIYYVDTGFTGKYIITISTLNSLLQCKGKKTTKDKNYLVNQIQVYGLLKKEV